MGFGPTVDKDIFSNRGKQLLFLLLILTTTRSLGSLSLDTTSTATTIG
jgi:hypothetical protein